MGVWVTHQNFRLGRLHKLCNKNMSNIKRIKERFFAENAFFSYYFPGINPTQRRLSVNSRRDERGYAGFGFVWGQLARGGRRGVALDSSNGGGTRTRGHHANSRHQLAWAHWLGRAASVFETFLSFVN